MKGRKDGSAEGGGERLGRKRRDPPCEIIDGGGIQRPAPGEDVLIEGLLRDAPRARTRERIGDIIGYAAIVALFATAVVPSVLTTLGVVGGVASWRIGGQLAIILATAMVFFRSLKGTMRSRPDGIALQYVRCGACGYELGHLPTEADACVSCAERGARACGMALCGAGRACCPRTPRSGRLGRSDASRCGAFWAGGGARTIGRGHACSWTSARWCGRARMGEAAAARCGRVRWSSAQSGDGARSSRSSLAPRC